MQNVAGLTTIRLRYHVVLSAPTAMVRKKDDVPVTYLNKGQAYSISVADKAPPSVIPTGACYRSCVRISFDDEQQRRHPASCWQLWKEGRGFNEANQRGGRLQAVEFVDSNTALSLSSNARMELESTSHDSFAVLWYPSGTQTKEYSIQLRFNFLSTDFSYSKGVMGIPVRLCVKTEMQLLGASGIADRMEEHIWTAETCYCKVKLFRDHGAERKLSSDIAHVKKSIEKVEEEIADAESSDNPHRPGKRKRYDWETSPVRSTLQNDTRSNSFDPMSSGTSIRDVKDLDGLKTKLAALQDKLVSTQPNSVLNLKGEDLDDPDMYPVHLPLEDSNDVLESAQKSSGGNRRNQSPASLHSQNSRGSSPPRASSIGTNGGHITPDTIPFQAFKDDAYQDELHQSIFPASKQLWAMAPAWSGNGYRYTAIQSEEVRLMVLYPGRFDDRDSVSCGLKAMPLHRLEGSQLVYQALSYAWGPKTYLQTIWVEDVPASGEQTDAAVSGGSSANVGSRQLYVGSNLYAALRRLRSESEELWFWIDAICIDQENLVEKADQLPKMLDIYCNAWSVCIWLGEAEWPSSFGPNEPFDLIATIVNLKLLDHIVEAPTIDEQMMSSLIAFAKLLKRPWFRRRWVIQEISSSTRASVQYGHKKVNWIDFADAIQLFVLKLDRIRALYRGSRLYERDPDALSHVEAAGASAIVRATNEVLRKGKDGRIVARLCDIETLVMRFVHFRASDPRDTIFALWSLACIRTTAHDHFPDLHRQLTVSPQSYMQSCESIFIDFVCHCIKLHESLDIICRHWALPLDDRYTLFEPPPRMQSWIGTTANSPFGMYLDSGGRMNGDSLVGEPGRKVYNASNNTLPAVHTVGRFGVDTLTMLQVTGHIISRVSQVSPRIVDGIVPYDALRLLGWTNRATVDTIPERLWRTLVADRAIDGSKAPSWWRRACMFALSMASRDGDLSTPRLLQNKSLPQTVHEYLGRVQAMVWNRRIFALEPATASETNAIPLPEMVGLGPRDTQQGDCACVLMGCSVPVILREVPSTEQNGVFELVGECYIHGMMDGEALSSTPSEAWSSVREFNLI